MTIRKFLLCVLIVDVIAGCSEGWYSHGTYTYAYAVVQYSLNSPMPPMSTDGGGVVSISLRLITPAV